MKRFVSNVAGVGLALTLISATGVLAAAQSGTPAAPADAPLSDGQTIAGIPVCAHDPTKWHALVERTADGSIACTYGHEHGSDPRQLDDIFGSLASTSGIGQEIGYPWTTSDLENSDVPLTTPTADGRPWAGGKHRVFKWALLTTADLVANGIGACPPNPYATYAFSNVRMQVHADGNAGATVRFHSFSLEAQTCSVDDASYHGLIRIGGHLDYGKLNGLESTPAGRHDIRIPLPGTDPPDSPYTAARRTHGTTAGSCAGCGGAVRNDFTWYGSNTTPWTATPGVPNIGISNGLREGDWGAVDPHAPGGPINFYAPPGDPNFDHGWAAPLDVLGASLPPASALNGAVTHADGTYSWSGFVDAHGNVVAACAPVSVSCIPASLTNVRPGSHQFANDVTHLPIRDYDVVVDGQTLIRFPN